MQPHSSVAALQLLVLFTEGKAKLEVKEYDALFDSVLEALEKANDETYRLSEPAEVLP